MTIYDGKYRETPVISADEKKQVPFGELSRNSARNTFEWNELQVEGGSLFL
jgi:hypothetical protein